jgi:hypothetical protein
MDDDAYIRDLKDKLIQRSKADAAAVEKENRESGIVSEKAPPDWERLKAWLKQKASQLPTDLVDFAIDASGDSLEIGYRVNRGRRRTEVAFRHISGVFSEISVKSSGSGPQERDFTFECEVQGNTLVWVYQNNRKVRFDIEGMGKAILTEATSA